MKSAEGVCYFQYIIAKRNLIYSEYLDDGDTFSFNDGQRRFI